MTFAPMLFAPMTFALAAEDPLKWEFYNNPLSAWLSALAIAAGTLVLMLIGRRIVSRRMGTRQIVPGLVDLPADLVRRTRPWFMVTVAIALGSLALQLPHRWDKFLHGATTIILLLQVAIWGNGIINYAAGRYVSRRSTPSGDGAQTPTTISALSILARTVLWLLLVLIALDNLDVKITTLVAGLGIGGVAIALAMQNILGDLFAALSIVLDKPFVVGDAITVDGLSGNVERIGLKTTRVRAPSGEQLVFANTDLVKSRIHNWRRLRERTVTLTIGLDGTTPSNVLARVPLMMRDIVTAQPQVRFDRSHVTTITDGNVAIETVYIVLTPDYGVFMNTQQAITLGLLDRLRRENIAPATPIRTLVSRDGAVSAPIPADAADTAAAR
jgi:small-conductance mechanosensitive channel